MTPHSIASALLEADELLPASDPEDQPGISTDDIKGYADTGSMEPVASEGMPIKGLYSYWKTKFGNRRPRRDPEGGNGRVARVDNNTWLVEYPEIMAVRFHHTDILQVTVDDTLKVNTNGWFTKTSFARICEWLPGGWRIYVKDHTWYWYNYKTEQIPLRPDRMKALQPYSDGDRITADGTLHPRAPIVYARVPKKRGE